MSSVRTFSFYDTIHDVISEQNFFFLFLSNSGCIKWAGPGQYNAEDADN